MDWLTTLFTHNWQRKCMALFTAIVIWFFVAHSITASKTIPNVPIHVFNLPPDKTIIGLLPNGVLAKRISLTLTGSKNIIDDLEPGDLEVNVDISQLDQEDSVIKLSRKNLVSLNPSIDLAHHIQEVQHPEFVLKLSKLVTAKIPIVINRPTGKAPQGYEYLDIWPQKLMQTISAPEEQVQALLNNGFEVTYDLSQISKADLDRVKSSRQNFHDDEVSYFIPTQWKKIAIPFRNNTLEDINDPEAQNLHIDFIRKEVLPIQRDLPVRVFYPLQTSDKWNLKTAPLSVVPPLMKKNEIITLKTPLYVHDVSRLFLDVIRDHIEIVLVAEPNEQNGELPWTVEVIDPKNLEDTYVSTLISHHATSTTDEPKHTMKRESHLRDRFHEYLKKLTLYISPDTPLEIEGKIQGSEVQFNTNLSQNAN